MIDYLINQMVVNSAFLLSAFFMMIYLISKNKIALAVVIETLATTYFYLLVGEGMEGMILNTTVCILLYGLMLYISKGNFLVFIAYSIISIYSFITYVVDIIYFVESTVTNYNIAMIMFNSYWYVFWPCVAFITIGLLYKNGGDNGRRDINNNDDAFRAGYVLTDIYHSGFMGYYEKRR